MIVTAVTLTAREDALFDALEALPGDDTFKGRLYRDGVPSPAVYLAQPVRVVFVFREPNMRGVPYAQDMRDQVRHPQFKSLVNGERREQFVRGWWNAKAGLFAHAVASALEGAPAPAPITRSGRFSTGASGNTRS